MYPDKRAGDAGKIRQNADKVWGIFRSRDKDWNWHGSHAILQEGKE